MIGTAPIAVVIAAKRLEAAKSRLAPAYSASARSRLALAMLADTIAAARAVPVVDGVTVVSADVTVAAMARELGAAVLADATPAGHPDPLNAAIRAGEVAVRSATPNVAVLQGDVPAARTDELADALTAARAHRRSFISDRQQTGTAALFAFNAPLDPAFGHDSAARHRSSGAVELRGRWDTLRCDIDTPEDIAAAVTLGVGVATLRVLDQFRVRRSA